MATRNISLTDVLDRFVEEQVRSGAYQNASEVVRTGLRLLEREHQEHALKLERLRAAVRVGLEQLDRGETESVDDLGAWFDRLDAEASSS